MRNLCLAFGDTPVVKDLSFDVPRGRTLAIVGESGSGKSVSAFAILGLLRHVGGSVRFGSITFDGRDLVGLGKPALRAIRGNRIGMIFQEPMTSLDPVFTIGDQIGESVKLHRGLHGGEARREAARLLDLVRLPDAKDQLRRYPHQLSGGMRQRVMIAIALACRPDLLIADKPTTALDVTIQAQVLQIHPRHAGRPRNLRDLHLARHGRGPADGGPRRGDEGRPDGGGGGGVRRHPDALPRLYRQADGGRTARRGDDRPRPAREV